MLHRAGTSRAAAVRISDWPCRRSRPISDPEPLQIPHAARGLMVRGIRPAVGDPDLERRFVVLVARVTRRGPGGRGAPFRRASSEPLPAPCFRAVLDASRRSAARGAAYGRKTPGFRRRHPRIVRDDPGSGSAEVCQFGTDPICWRWPASRPVVARGRCECGYPRMPGTVSGLISATGKWIRTIACFPRQATRSRRLNIARRPFMGQSSSGGILIAVL
jgi:hypothetical protein